MWPPPASEAGSYGTREVTAQPGEVPAPSGKGDLKAQAVRSLRQEQPTLPAPPAPPPQPLGQGWASLKAQTDPQEEGAVHSQMQQHHPGRKWAGLLTVQSNHTPALDTDNLFLSFNTKSPNKCHSPHPRWRLEEGGSAFTCPDN